MSLDEALVRSALASRYTLERAIGAGGMAVVYRGCETKQDREVAIKVLRPELAVAVGAERFLREVRIASRLQHPGVLPIYDSGQAGAYLYYVMPFAEGGSLSDRLERDGPLSLDDALRITREVGDALTYAHQQGVIHRDVKPANIVFSKGRALLADFGVAKAVADVDMKTITDSGVVLGTPAYMSPEQAAADRRLDPRADQYSLACVLFEMLTGEPPFIGRTMQAVVARHLSERPPALVAVRPDLPAPLSEVIGKALAKVPADRFATMELFLAAVEDGARGVSVPSRQTRRRAVYWAAAAIAVAAVATTVLLWPAAPSLVRSRVAVFPLATRGPGFAGTGAGTDAAYLLEASLEQAGPLSFIDVTSRLDERQLANPEVISSTNARKIARVQGAAFYLQGVVQGHGDSTTVILRLYDVAGDSLILQQSASGSADVPIHVLGIDAVKQLLPALIDPAHRTDLSPLRDRKPRAIALWMQGEREYRRAKFAAALQLYERALGEDSLLALAAVKGAQSASWLHQSPRGASLVGLALDRAPLLPPRYVLLSRGLRHYFGGTADSATHWLKEAVAGSTGWAEALTALGEVYAHLLPNEAPLDSLADAAFAAAIDADNEFAPALFHRVESLLRHGEATRAEPLFARFEAMEPDRQLRTQLDLMRECVSAPRHMQWNARAGVAATDVVMAGKALAVAGYQFTCAEGAFRSVLASASAAPSERWGGLIGLFSVLVATGREREARSLVDSAAATTGAARSLYVIGTAAGARMHEPAAALELFARQKYGERYERIPNSENLWIIAVWLSANGNAVGLRVLDSTIAARAAKSGDPKDRVFAASVAARLALLSDSARAVRLLYEEAKVAPGNVAWGFASGLSADRLLLARLQLARREYREALKTASAFDHPEPMIFVPFVPASLAVRYQAATALGDVAAAGKFRARLQELNRGELLKR